MSFNFSFSFWFLLKIKTSNQNIIWISSGPQQQYGDTGGQGKLHHEGQRIRARAYQVHIKIFNFNERSLKGLGHILVHRVRVLFLWSWFNSQISIGVNTLEWTYSFIRGHTASGTNWDHLGSIHVFWSQKPETEPFVVSYNLVTELRYRVSRGHAISQSDINDGWNQHFVFWAYPNNGRWFPHPYEGFIPTYGNGKPGNCYVPFDVPPHLQRATRNNSFPRERKPRNPGELRGALGLKKQLTVIDWHGV